MLLIKNARILDHDGVKDILISDEGKYLEIRPNIDESAIAGVQVIDAKEMMAAPTFVNTHMHFDKAYTSLRGREDSTETLEDSIRIMHDRIRALHGGGRQGPRHARIRECVMYGTTKLRTNVDISNLDPNPGRAAGRAGSQGGDEGHLRPAGDRVPAGGHLLQRGHG